MIKKLVIFLVVALLIMTISSNYARQIDEDNMIEFSATNLQRIDYGILPEVSPTQMTVYTSINFDGVTTLGRVAQQFYQSAVFSPTSRAWSLYVSGGRINFEVISTTSPYVGSWSAPITTGQHSVAVTMDFSSISNNPVFFVDGYSATVTEDTTPLGSFPTGTINLTFSIGDVSSTDTYLPMDGKVYSFLIYNRILSPAEILDAYNSRKAIPNYNGLVFAPDLRGATGGVDDGDTLGATNYIRDRISGATGTPSGSPVFAADNYLNY